MKQRKFLGLALFVSCAGGLLAQTTVTEKSWGSVDGKPVALYTLADKDLTVNITTYGARVVALDAPDRRGVKADVVLGYNNVGQFAADKSTYFGAIVGRYGNRIAKGTYKIDGNTYHAPMNDHGINMLHGGTVGFD